LLAAIVVEVAEGPTWRRLVAMASVALFLVPAVMTAGGGRAGLPPDRWSERLGFVATLAETPSSTRVLLIGPAGDLPGASRSLGSVSYRLIDGGVATLEQAYLPNFQAGDAALVRVIVDHVIRGVDLRPGAALAEFGIGWVVVLPGSDFDTHALDRQVDLALTPVDPDLTVYENLAESVRAITDQGAVWEWDGRTYRGEATDGRVRLADNPDGGWGPDWALAGGWANSVSGEDGVATFTPDPLGRAAGLASGSLLLALLTLILWGTRISRPSKRVPDGEVRSEAITEAQDRAEVRP
jgi:hypothetical protein